jgi:hypothetical protein
MKRCECWPADRQTLDLFDVTEPPCRPALIPLSVQWISHSLSKEFVGNLRDLLVGR